MASAAIDTISFEEYTIIQENQCPLPPRRWEYINEEGKRIRIRTTAWFYRDKFWVKEENSNKVYSVDISQKELKKHKHRLNQMRTVDEYISEFSLTSSVQIYKMLTAAINPDALSPTTKAGLNVNNNNTNFTGATLLAKKFNPTWRNRIGFLFVVGRAILNAYFIISNFIRIEEVPLNYRLFVFIIVSIEALLFFMAACRALYNFYSLVKRMCTGGTTHFQVKNIPENLRQIGSLSVMRYLPNGEAIGMANKRFREWISSKKASFKFQLSNTYRFKYLVMLRWLILAILDVIGPVVAVFSLLFKMAQLNFEFDALFAFEWYKIVGYFAFVNQVAGIRKVRKTEIDAIEHFIFSGSDIKLSVEENLLLEAWWNYTVVSCVANICDAFKFPVYDSIIFWYHLNVRSLQLLFKDHKGLEGNLFIDKKGKIKKDRDFTKYDKSIQNQLQQQLQKGRISSKKDIQMMMKVDTLEHDDDDIDDDNYKIKIANPPKQTIEEKEEEEEQNEQQQQEDQQEEQ